MTRLDSDECSVDISAANLPEPIEHRHRKLDTEANHKD